MYSYYKQVFLLLLSECSCSYSVICRLSLVCRCGRHVVVIMCGKCGKVQLLFLPRMFIAHVAHVLSASTTTTTTQQVDGFFFLLCASSFLFFSMKRIYIFTQVHSWHHYTSKLPHISTRFVQPLKYLYTSS